MVIPAAFSCSITSYSFKTQRRNSCYHKIKQFHLSKRRGLRIHHVKLTQLTSALHQGLPPYTNQLSTSHFKGNLMSMPAYSYEKPQGASENLPPTLSLLSVNRTTAHPRKPNPSPKKSRTHQLNAILPITSMTTFSLVVLHLYYHTNS